MPEMKRPMEIHHPDGRVEIVDVVMTFEFKDTKKEFIIYTDNIIDKDGVINLCCYEIIRDINNEATLWALDENDLTTYYRIRDIVSRLAKNGKGIVNRPIF